MGISSASAEERHSRTVGLPVAALGRKLDFDLSKVPLTRLKWRRKNGLLLTNFTIQNMNTVPVANIVVRCTFSLQTFSIYYGGSEERTLTQTIDPPPL